MRIGDLINFFVVKAMPDYDAYLTCVKGGELLALLPKRFAGKEFKVGEPGWAAVFTAQGARVVLTRTSPQFIRRYLEYSLKDFLARENMKIKKIARIRNAGFCKVAVETALSQTDLYEKFRKALPERFRQEIRETIVPVKYSMNPEEYVVNALSPAPAEAVRKVIYLREMQVVAVYVDLPMVGRFAGKNGVNVATAAKLTGLEIELKGIRRPE